MATRRVVLDQRLGSLEHDVVAVGALVLEALAAAGDALLSGDAGAADAVARLHQQICDECRRIEEQAFEVLAREQPAAGDLRLVLTVVRLTHELERCGGLSRHVGRAGQAVQRALTARLRGLVEQLLEEGVHLFSGAMDAFVRRDVQHAQALEVWDDRIDELHRALLAELLDAQLGLEATIELALLGRYLERLGDHAVLIGGRVRYLVTGEL